jgi:hypothetical protein
MSFWVGGRGAFQANIAWCTVFPAMKSLSNSILPNVAIIISLNFFALYFRCQRYAPAALDQGSRSRQLIDGEMIVLHPR